MPLMELRNQLARLHVEGGEQRGGAMPPVVVRAPLDLPRAHRQHRLGTIQRLNLGLLIDSEQYGMGRRLHVEADDVPDFLDQQRIGRQLERLSAMRLQTKGTPDLLN